jgi:hypothetical protein
MGSKIVIGALAGTSASNAVGASVLHTMSEYEYKERVIESIEERCEQTFSIIDLGLASHSFIVFKTDNGEHVRADFTSSGKITTTYFYYPDESSVTFRKSKIDTKLPLSQALEIFSNHANKSPYNLVKHNCQHVARDTYNEITNSSQVMLWNDFAWLMRKNAPLELRDKHSKITKDAENKLYMDYTGRDITNCLFNDEKYGARVKKMNVEKVVKNMRFKDSVITNPGYCLLKFPRVVEDSGKFLSDGFRKWEKELRAVYF